MGLPLPDPLCPLSSTESVDPSPPHPPNTIPGYATVNTQIALETAVHVVCVVQLSQNKLYLETNLQTSD
jgi:hypothetical protein